MRLDLKIAKELNISRNKACEMIKKGEVFVDEKLVLKASFEIEDQKIFMRKMPLISRAGEKLEKFLQSYPIKIEGKNCLDIGSSTGGFLQILLSSNAAKLTAVDVGTNQLHESLKNHVNLHENTDIRDFCSDEFFDIITCDLSFIAFKDVAKSINNLNFDKIIILFKPQFEVGKEAKRNKKGVVVDKKAIFLAKQKFMQNIQSFGWKFLFSQESQIAGKEGNVESFYVFAK